MSMQHIATLNLYVDLEVPKEVTYTKPSGLTRIGDNEWALILHPPIDVEVLGTMNLLKATNAEQSILAHELGHWMDELSKIPLLAKIERVLDPVPEEEHAWTNAAKIDPNLNTSIRDVALESYKEADKESS